MNYMCCACLRCTLASREVCSGLHDNCGLQPSTRLEASARDRCSFQLRWRHIPDAKFVDNLQAEEEQPPSHDRPDAKVILPA